MNKKLLNAILILLGIVVLIISAFPIGMILALGFWIYLGVIVLKRKSIFHEELEPGLIEKLSKRLKAMMILAVISFLVSIVGIIMHNVRFSLSKIEESLFFFIGIVALYLFIFASAFGLFIFLKGRQKPI